MLSLSHLIMSYYSYAARDDHAGGYVYLMQVTNLPPGIYLKTRYKIGLSRNPEARRQTIISNQPGHDLKILKAIYVEDMAWVEGTLHQMFANSNVDLEKSREYFDFYPWQLAILKFQMNRYDSQFVSWADLPFKKIALTLMVVFGLGVFAAVPVLQLVEQNSVTEQKID